MVETFQIGKGVPNLDGYDMLANTYGGFTDEVLLFFRKIESNPDRAYHLRVVLTQPRNLMSDVELTDASIEEHISFPKLTSYSLTEKTNKHGESSGTLGLNFERGGMLFSFVRAFFSIEIEDIKYIPSADIPGELARNIEAHRHD